ncbi:MAG: RNase P modulator RnpM [Armatimonadota bacterium]
MARRSEPIRTCVACRTERPKAQLVRVVRTPDGRVALDPTRKRSGRGAYLCPSLECLQTALKRRSLERALGVPIGEDLKASLESEMAQHQDPAR